MSMPESTFSERDVQRAIREIRNAGEALSTAGLNEWQSAAQQLVFLLQQPLAHAILAESAVPPIDVADVRTQMHNARAGRLGSDPISLPVSPADRAATAAAVVTYLAELSGRDFANALIDLVGMQSSVPRMVARANEHLVRPIISHIGGRLEELRAPAAAGGIQVTGGSGHVIVAGNVDGHVHGGVIAGNRDVVANSPGAISAQGRSRVENSSVVYEPRTHYARMFIDWADTMPDVPTDQRDAVRSALEVAARAADGEAVRGSQLVGALETINESSPTMFGRLKSFAEHVAVHYASMQVADHVHYLPPLLMSALRVLFPEIPHHAA
jgi:hypothetical protein